MTNMRVFTMIIILGFANGLFFRVVPMINRIHSWNVTLLENNDNINEYNGTIDDHLLLHIILE